MKDTNAIEVKNVRKSFKVYLDKGHTLKELALFSQRRKKQRRVVLEDISFSIPKGQTVALIGHNGCGKSTTLKLLTKIMYPDSGTISMSGRVSSLIELGAGFHPDMSGRENIYINASIFGLTKKEIDARLNDIIAFSELEKFIDNPVRTYSSGMYMRLAFAVAINVDADILLVDEILAVGDTNFQAKCFEKMKELKANGLTIIIVTHDINTVRSFCDRAIWLNEGNIVEDGPARMVADQYIAYMSNERVEALNTEENHSFNNEKHFGNGKVLITNCQLLNENQKPVNALRFNEKYYLKFDYEVKEKVDRIVVGMGIFTVDGFWIFGTNSNICGVEIPVTGDRGSVLFESDKLNLLTGEYILQCSIIEEDSTPCDYYNEYRRFNVINDHAEAGIIHYDTKWNVVNE